MSIFWQCFCAYCIGWVAMNIFCAQIANRVQGNDAESKRRRAEMARQIADRITENVVNAHLVVPDSASSPAVRPAVEKGEA